MVETKPVTVDYFVQRLQTLCLKSGLSGMPKSDLDQHILLKSAALKIGLAGPFTEKEVNEKLSFWINQISGIKKIDQTTLRRRLVDTGYLSRTKDGSSYQVNPEAPRPQFFDPAVAEIDVDEVITRGREEIARRKQAFLNNRK